MQLNRGIGIIGFLFKPIYLFIRNVINIIAKSNFLFFINNITKNHFFQIINSFYC